MVNSIDYSTFDDCELLNTILSGSHDKSVRLWDIRSGKQIQVFNGHTNTVFSVEYSPFNELHIIKEDEKEDSGILCLKFVSLKKKDNTKNVKYDLDLCYGSCNGPIRIMSLLNKRPICSVDNFFISN
ncbi:hypothetical protein RFI_00627 [Reticulomyxa filosa]|uniref:Uncharacterized protein n=1 Tax=Reticulomyxa filosa TaxID=46433 RepID=X6PE11_RETFI|nr:hypothetical protein RFI_00627 [Reticulomyxa filosa]|eukprot:ETO36436.1 hypothetical protein RFI_00627 [Reticulomyxa filosa]